VPRKNFSEQTHSANSSKTEGRRTMMRRKTASTATNEIKPVSAVYYGSLSNVSMNERTMTHCETDALTARQKKPIPPECRLCQPEPFSFRRFFDREEKRLVATVQAGCTKGFLTDAHRCCTTRCRHRLAHRKSISSAMRNTTVTCSCLKIWSRSWRAVAHDQSRM
jgi:hypothetical protein